MSKRCFQCGEVLEDSAVFCDECGTKQPEQLKSPYVAEVISNQAIDNQGKKDLGRSEQNNTIIKNSGLGIASFVVGIVAILSFGCFVIPNIVGLVLGIISLTEKGKKHGFAIAGVVLSVLAVLMLLLILVIGLSA